MQHTSVLPSTTFQARCKGPPTWLALPKELKLQFLELAVLPSAMQKPSCRRLLYDSQIGNRDLQIRVIKRLQRWEAVAWDDLRKSYRISEEVTDHFVFLHAEEKWLNGPLRDVVNLERMIQRYPSTVSESILLEFFHKNLSFDNPDYHASNPVSETLRGPSGPVRQFHGV